VVFLCPFYRILNYGHDLRSLIICTACQICPGDQIEKNEIGGACNTYGERRGVYRVLVRNPEGKKPLGRPSRRWEHNIKMGLQEVGMLGYGLD